MRILILLPMLLAACSEPAQDAGPPMASNSPVGLYERSGVPDRPSRICIAGQGAAMRFGVNTSYEGPQSCTAKGTVRQAGASLTLLIDGNPACSLKATATATGLSLDSAEGPECAYYCGTNTGFDPGAQNAFAKVGSTEADARRAVDLVGDPLC